MYLPEDILKLAAGSLAKASTHEPVGPNPLWHHKGWQLPAYIQHIANDLREKRGMTESRAIATAVAVVKRWSAGVGKVDANTKAAASKALAEWEQLKSKAKGSKGSKAASTVKASKIATRDKDNNLVKLATAPDNGSSYNMDDIRDEWREQLSAQRTASDSAQVYDYNYSYVKEVWSDFIIVQDEDADLYKVPYTVDNGNVKFDKPVAVKVVYVEDPEEANEQECPLCDNTDEGMASPVGLTVITNSMNRAEGTSSMSALDKIIQLSTKATEVNIVGLAKSDGPPKPYGSVTYADPKNGKYPLDNVAHIKAAWSYINMPKNAAKYPLNGVSLASVKAKIKAAAKKAGIQISE